MTHPILVKLHNMAMEEELLGLRWPSGKPCIVQALADDHIMFLAPRRENISKTRDVWDFYLFFQKIEICGNCFQMLQG